MADDATQQADRPCIRGRRRALAAVPIGALGVLAVLVVVRTIGSLLTGEPQVAAWREILRGTLWQSTSLAIGALPVLPCVLLALRRGPPAGAARIALVVAAVAVSSVVGLALRMSVGSLFGLGPSWQGLVPMSITVLPRNFFLGAMLAAALEFSRREQHALAREQEAELQRAALVQERTESMLQLLRAQIEPHFLFNTLANVRRLLTRDGPRGRAMLAQLTQYIATALPSMRDGAPWSLGKELDLARAYLRLNEVRMGTRLVHRVDVPEVLHAVAVPPMMLLTLVENAVKHGIDRSARGGTVAIGARLLEGDLVMSVRDDGAGFASVTGTGTGLANLQLRLAAEFGPAGALQLEVNDAGGVTATVRMPLARLQPAGRSPGGPDPASVR